MFGMKVKDLALVAFAGGLLAVEMVGLQAAAPAALRSLAAVTGMPLVQSAARTARAATQSMVNGFTDAAAQAAVAGIQAVPGAIQGTAERVAAATPIRVAQAAPHARSSCSYRYVMVARGARSAARVPEARQVAWQSEACRAEVRAIVAEKRAECAQARAKRAEAAARAITTVSEASAL